MSYEIVQITSWTNSVNAITNPGYAYDNGTGGGPVTGYDYSSPFNYSANDTYYANQTSGVNSTLYTLISSGMSARTKTWISSNLVITYELITAGDNGTSQNNSTADIYYTTDGTTWNLIETTSGNWDTGRSTHIYSLGANPTLATIKVRMQLTGASKTGTLPDIILGAAATGYLWHAYVEGTITDYITSFTNDGPLLIGSHFTLTLIFTGTAPTVSPGVWSTWVSGVAQGTLITIFQNTTYTATQGSNVAYTTAVTKLQASGAISMNDVTVISGTSTAANCNSTQFRTLTGTTAGTTDSFSQLYGKNL